MKKLLLSKGFELTYCNISHENYWEYTDNKGDNNTDEIARLFGIDEDQDIEYVVLQCKEDFSDCKVAANDLVWSLSKEDFFDKVNKI